MTAFVVTDLGVTQNQEKRLLDNAALLKETISVQGVSCETKCCFYAPVPQDYLKAFACLGLISGSNNKKHVSGHRDALHIFSVTIRTQMFRSRLLLFAIGVRSLV